MDIETTEELCGAVWGQSGEMHLSCNLPPNHAEEDHETDFGGGTIFWSDTEKKARFVTQGGTI